MRSSKTAGTTPRPKFQPLPDLPPNEFAALKADIAERGGGHHPQAKITSP